MARNSNQHVTYVIVTGLLENPELNGLGYSVIQRHNLIHNFKEMYQNYILFK